MVQNLSSFFFEKHHVNTVFQPELVVSASNDRLLIARNSRHIEVQYVHKTQTEHKVSVYFPTIADAIALVHCAAYDYIGTLETDVVGDQCVPRCRVYVDWQKVAVPLDELKTKDFIKGRNIKELPAIHSLKYLNVVEIKKQADYIACCQTTGKLLTGHKTEVFIYEPAMVKHPDDLSISFLYFQPMLMIPLKFVPCTVSITDDTVAFGDPQHLIILKVGEEHPSEKTPTLESNNSVQRDFVIDDDIDEDVKQSIHNDIIKDGAVSLMNLIKMANYEDIHHHFKDVIHPNSFPISAYLPGINAEKVEPYQPELFGIQINDVPSLYDSTVSSGTTSTDVIYSLLDLNYPNGIEYENKITHVLLQPLYAINFEEQNDVSALKSNHTKEHRIGIICLVTTVREGFLFYAPMNTFYLGKCVLVSHYVFSSELINVCLHQYVLHALTTSGVETFNIPSNEFVVHKWKKVSPASKNPVLQLGFHPFVGVMNFAVNEDYMVVFCKPDEFSPENESLECTAYYLKLPTALKLYQNLSDEIKEHQKTNEDTYIHLSMLAYEIIHVAANLEIHHQVASDLAHMVQTHKEASLHLMNLCFKRKSLEYYRSGFQYFVNASVELHIFLDDLKTKYQELEIDTLDGLLYLIRKWLKTFGDKLEFEDASSIVDFVQIRCSYCPLYLSNLVLSNERFSEVGCSKVLHIIKDHVNQSLSERHFEVPLATCLLYFHSGLNDDALRTMELINADDDDVLIPVLIRYGHILFQGETATSSSLSERDNDSIFSEFGVFWMESTPQFFGTVVGRTLLQMAKTPSRYLSKMEIFGKFLKNTNTVNERLALKSFLEVVLSAPNRPRLLVEKISSAFEVLVDFYVSDLKDAGPGNGNSSCANVEEYKPIFCKSLPSFLQETPKIECDYLTLCRLQDLLCADFVDHLSIKDKIGDIIKSLPTKYHIYLYPLIDTNFGITALLDECEDAILSYAKDMFETNEQWRNLVRAVWNHVKLPEMATTSTSWGTLNDILEYVACTKTVKEYKAITRHVPNNMPIYQQYLLLAQKTNYANTIKDFVQNTGRQLLNSCSYNMNPL